MAKCEYPELVWGETIGLHHASHQIVIPELPEPKCYYHPSTNWAQGGPIIEREGISIIRCDDDYKTDAKGFTTNKRIPVWAAEHGGGHSAHETYGSQGDYWGDSYEITEAYCSYGTTLLIATMRCYVASKLGDEIEVPEELSGRPLLACPAGMMG